MEMKTLFLLDAGIGALMAALAIPMIMEKVKPNRLYGFRTPKTLSDEKIWYPANKYSGKTVLIAGLVIFAFSLVFYYVTERTTLLSSLTPMAIFLIWGGVLMIPIIAMTVASFLYLRKL